MIRITTGRNEGSSGYGIVRLPHGGDNVRPPSDRGHDEARTLVDAPVCSGRNPQGRSPLKPLAAGNDRTLDDATERLADVSRQLATEREMSASLRAQCDQYSMETAVLKRGVAELRRRLARAKAKNAKHAVGSVVPLAIASRVEPVATSSDNDDEGLDDDENWYARFFASELENVKHAADTSKSIAQEIERRQHDLGLGDEIKLQSDTIVVALNAADAPLPVDKESAAREIAALRRRAHDSKSMLAAAKLVVDSLKSRTDTLRARNVALKEAHVDRARDCAAELEAMEQRHADSAARQSRAHEAMQRDADLRYADVRAQLSTLALAFEDRERERAENASLSPHSEPPPLSPREPPKSTARELEQARASDALAAECERLRAQERRRAREATTQAAAAAALQRKQAALRDETEVLHQTVDALRDASSQAVDDHTVALSALRRKHKVATQLLQRECAQLQSSHTNATKQVVELRAEFAAQTITAQAESESAVSVRAQHRAASAELLELRRARRCWSDAMAELQSAHTAALRAASASAQEHGAATLDVLRAEYAAHLAEREAVTTADRAALNARLAAQASETAVTHAMVVCDAASELDQLRAEHGVKLARLREAKAEVEVAFEEQLGFDEEKSAATAATHAAAMKAGEAALAATHAVHADVLAAASEDASARLASAAADLEAKRVALQSREQRHSVLMIQIELRHRRKTSMLAKLHAEATGELRDEHEQSVSTRLAQAEAGAHSALRVLEVEHAAALETLNAHHELRFECESVAAERELQALRSKMKAMRTAHCAPLRDEQRLLRSSVAELLAREADLARAALEQTQQAYSDFASRTKAQCALDVAAAEEEAMLAVTGALADERSTVDKQQHEHDLVVAGLEAQVAAASSAAREAADTRVAVVREQHSSALQSASDSCTSFERELSEAKHQAIDAALKLASDRAQFVVSLEAARGERADAVVYNAAQRERFAAELSHAIAEGERATAALHVSHSETVETVRERELAASAAALDDLGVHHETTLISLRENHDAAVRELEMAHAEHTRSAAHKSAEQVEAHAEALVSTQRACRLECKALWSQLSTTHSAKLLCSAADFSSAEAERASVHAMHAIRIASLEADVHRVTQRESTLAAEIVAANERDANFCAERVRHSIELEHLTIAHKALESAVDAADALNAECAEDRDALAARCARLTGEVSSTREESRVLVEQWEALKLEAKTCEQERTEVETLLALGAAELTRLESALDSALRERSSDVIEAKAMREEAFAVAHALGETELARVAAEDRVEMAERENVTLREQLVARDAELQSSRVELDAALQEVEMFAVGKHLLLDRADAAAAPSLPLDFAPAVRVSESVSSNSEAAGRALRAMEDERVVSELSQLVVEMEGIWGALLRARFQSTLRELTCTSAIDALAVSKERLSQTAGTLSSLVRAQATLPLQPPPSPPRLSRLSPPSPSRSKTLATVLSSFMPFSLSQLGCASSSAADVTSNFLVSEDYAPSTTTPRTLSEAARRVERLLFVFATELIKANDRLNDYSDALMQPALRKMGAFNIEFAIASGGE